MSSDQLRQIEELYRSVREYSPEARAALLGQADPELRRRLRCCGRASFFRTRRDTGPAAVSPDGRRLVFSARSVDRGPQLYVRSLETVVPQDGQVRAHDAKTGKIIWDFDTAREFPTVNGMQAKGGSMAATGATVADGMLYLNSGYSSMPGNVLPAFGAK